MTGEDPADDRPRVAAFRPADGRAERAGEYLRSKGVTPVIDPMLQVKPTGETPEGADWVVLTASTGVELAHEAGWEPTGVKLACIGATTAEAAREVGWTVDLVPEEYSSAGLVDALSGLAADAGDGTADHATEADDAHDATEADDAHDTTEADDAHDATEADDGTGAPTVELARSDHGSAVLPDGLREAGLTVDETTLYRLTRPPESGESAELAASGRLDGAVFTSSLTVEHVLDAAAERADRQRAIEGLNEAVVGAIGEPTAETARDLGVTVDVVPESASFERTADAVCGRLDD